VVRFNGYHSLKDLPGFSDFKYDFVGSKDSQQRKCFDALKVWTEQIDRPTPSGATLIDQRGGLMKDNFQRLRKQRLDPPVVLIE